MLTLQILDAGETFYRTIEATLTVGSSESADVRLTEGDVAPEHARVQLLDDGRIKIVDLGSESGTRVNGEDVVQVRLDVGDRIEIGASVLVVGKRVARDATAADVLEDGAQVRRSRVRDREPKKRGFPVGVVAGVLAVGALVGFLMTMGGGDALPNEWLRFTQLRNKGNVADARVVLDQMRTGWAGEDAGRSARLDELGAELDAIETALTAGRERIRGEAYQRTRAEQVDELKAVVKRDENSPRAIAARLLMSELEDLRRSAPRPAGGGVAGQPAVSEVPADESEAGEPEAGEAAAQQDVADAATAAAVASELAAIDEAQSGGRLAEALERANLALTALPAEAAGPVRERRLDLRRTIDREQRQLEERLLQQTASGAAPDFEAAIAELKSVIDRYPTTGEFSRLRHLQTELDRQLAAALAQPTSPAAGGAPAGVSLDALRKALMAARADFSDGMFGAAAQGFEQAAALVASSDPGMAEDLLGRAKDAKHLATWMAALSSATDEQNGPEILMSAGAAELRRADDGSLRVVTAAGREPFDWEQVRAAGLQDVASSVKAQPDALVGAGVLAYRLGDRHVAETLLGSAIKKRKDLGEEISGVIGRGRGDGPGSEGYRWRDDRFVSLREIRVEKRAKELSRDVSRMLKAKPERRDPMLDAILAKGPQELDALVVALRTEAEKLVTRIGKNKFRRHYDQVAEARGALDKARSHAKELIYDEKRYFYPYKPPAVTPQKASEYAAVQQEVDERVAVVRDLWEGTTFSRRVPQKLLDELAQFDWVVNVLEGFAESVPDLVESTTWVRALPEGELTLQSFCWDVLEREESRIWQAVLDFNETLVDDVARAEFNQAAITNAYRLMFGHRPLAVDKRLVEAARGHALEMSKLGYFSHFSPTPGRRTPFERMKLAGYGRGASENIALHASAASAHHGWTHSSGHHRNLLNPSHTEFAVGNDGRYWVQNFGRSDDYLSADGFVYPKRR